jgi:hypothetical protein
MSLRISSGSSAVATTSEMASRPPRLQDPVGLGKDAGFVGGEVDDAVREDDLDAPVCHRQILDFPEAEFDIPVVALLRVGAGLGNHFRGHVHPDDPACFADLPPGEETVKAAAAAEVEDNLAGFERGDGLGVSAAQPHVGPLRHGADLLGAVAKLLG